MDVKIKSEYNNQVCLESSDKKRFVIPVETAYRMGTLKTMLEDCQFLYHDIYGIIPLPRVHSTVLEQILDWLEKYKPEEEAEQVEQEAASAEAKLTNARLYKWNVWEKVFGKSVKCKHLVAIINSADYLDIAELVQFGTGLVAQIIKHRTFHDMQNFMGVKNPNNYNRVVGCVQDELYYDTEDYEDDSLDDDSDDNDEPTEMPSPQQQQGAGDLVVIEDIGEDMEADTPANNPNNNSDDEINLEHNS